MKKIKKVLFKIARSKVSGFFIGFIFENLSFLIPVDKISETKKIIAFYHPVKHWEKHILVIPKKSIRTFLRMNLNTKQGEDLTISVYKTAVEIAKREKMDKYTILVNGGKYQDVPQVHFHLASGKDKNGGMLGNELSIVSGKKVSFESDNTSIYKIDDKKIKTHFILVPKTELSPIANLDLENKDVKKSFIDIFKSAQIFLNEFKLSAFTLLVNQGSEKKLILHIISKE